MSIIATLRELGEAGELVLYKPTVAPPPGRFRRTLWLNRDAYSWCCPVGDHPDVRVKDDSVVDLQSVLNAFVFNEELEQGIDMKHLDPPLDEVWEFRSLTSKPRLRLFGSFALPSIFVATNYRVRDDLEHSRGPKWDRVISDTGLAVRSILGDVLPFTSDRFSNYLRGATYV